MADSQVDCPSSVNLTEAEIAWLESLPHAAHDMPGRVWCELGAAHTGRHVALGQADDVGGPDGPEVNYWIWWEDDGSTYEIANGEACGARLGDPESDLCLLPVDHPGRHLF